MTVKIKPSCRGEYKLQITRGNGDVFDIEKSNTLLDNFFEYFTTQTTGWALGGDIYAHFGEGTSATDVTDTTLETPVTPVSARISGVGIDSYVADSANGTLDLIRTVTITCPTGQFVGTLGEMGIGITSSTTDTTIYSRALITDSDDNPTTIVVTASDQITLTYIFTATFEDSYSFSFDVDDGGTTVSTTVNYVLGFYAQKNLDDTFGYCHPVTQNVSAYIYPSTSSIGDVNATVTGNSGAVTYINNSPTETVSASGRNYSITFSSSQANVSGGISIIALNNDGTESTTTDKISWDPVLNKTSLSDLTIGFDFLPVRT